jgi:hypothetical protein
VAKSEKLFLYVLCGVFRESEMLGFFRAVKH